MPVRKQKSDRPRSTPEESAARLRAMRLRLGLTQDALAAKLGVTRTAIVQVESGRRHITLDWCYDAAAALGVAPSSLDPRLTDSTRRPPGFVPDGPAPGPEPLPDHIPIPD